MKKTKMEKGITLIALIITIVVLLILAVVAINAIIKDDILERAEKSALKYNQSVENEQETMGTYGEYLENHMGGKTILTSGTWTQDKTSVTNGSVTLTVGQTVTGYDAGVDTYTGGWAILGAENGKLLLVSKTSVKDEEFIMPGSSSSDGVDLLNSICSTYKGESADLARSIKAEDINRITGYTTPESTSYYQYYISDYLSTDCEAYRTLVNNGIKYWLANECVDGDVDYNDYGIMKVTHSYRDGELVIGDLCGNWIGGDSQHGYYPEALSVLAVIELKTGVELKVVN